MGIGNIKLDKFNYRISSLFDSEALSLMNAESQSSATYMILSEYIVSKHGYNSVISGFNVNVSYNNGILSAIVSPGSCIVDGSFISIKSRCDLSIELSNNFNGIFIVNIYYDYKMNIYEYSDIYVQINAIIDGHLYPNSYVNVRKGFLPIYVKILNNGNIEDYNLNSINVNGTDIDISYLRSSSFSGNINIGDLELDGNFRISDNKIIIDSSYRYTTYVNSEIIDNGIVYLPGRINSGYLNRINVFIVGNSTDSISPPMVYPYDISVGENYIIINDRSNLYLGDRIIIDYIRSD
ncbi:MAG: hypothetical protein QXD03_04765 [Candidatus Anstonellales archaeon]